MMKKFCFKQFGCNKQLVVLTIEALTELYCIGFKIKHRLLFLSFGGSAP